MTRKAKPAATVITTGFEKLTIDSTDSATPRRKTAITNLPERPCPTCGHNYRYAWGWLIVLPAARAVDLCAFCSRALRYGSQAERRAIANAIATREVAL